MILNAKAEYGVPVKIYTRDVDEESLTQLRKMAQLQFIHSHIAVMPDVHLGKGATVGSVIRAAAFPRTREPGRRRWYRGLCGCITATRYCRRHRPRPVCHRNRGLLVPTMPETGA